MKRIVICLINILLLAVSCSALAGSIFYTKVYEPATSWPMAATVAWLADGNTLETARADVRPATTFVWLDAGLKVYDRDGGLLSDSLDSAEPVLLEHLDGGRQLMLWRWHAEMTVNGKNFGHYYLYSNPFVFSPEDKKLPRTGDDADPALWMLAVFTGLTTVAACGRINRNPGKPSSDQD